MTRNIMLVMGLMYWLGAIMPVAVPQAFAAKTSAAAATQGIASLTPDEIHKLAALYVGTSDAAKVLGAVIANADAALQQPPEPVASVVTSGSSIKTAEKSNSSDVEHQAEATYTLALAYAVTGKDAYFDQARKYLMAWAQVNQPQGDAVAELKFVPMVRAYDLIHGRLPPADSQTIETWFKGIGEAVLSDQEAARAKDSPRGINNHRSHALLILAAIGCAIDEPRLIHYVTDRSGFLDHIGKNLASFDGEPPHAGVDFHQRRAYHYVAYDLQSLGRLAILIDRIGHLPGNPYGIDYNPYTVQVKGASLLATLRVLLPYATGEKTNANEFEGSTNKNDFKRLGKGVLRSTFYRKDAIAALEPADYFFIAVSDPQAGKNYNLAQVVTDIITAVKGRSALPAAYPTMDFLIDDVISPYRQNP